MKKGLVAVGILLLVAAPLIVVCGTVYTLMLPNLYSASARIAVTEPDPEIDPFAPNAAGSYQYNPYYLREQFEILQSKPILVSVSNRLNLQKEWGKDGEKLSRDIVVKILQNSIQIIQMRDTSLIMIVVRRDDPDEAARIANELAEVYRDARLDADNMQKRNVLTTMEEELVRQSDRVLEAEKRVEALRAAGKAPPSEANTLLVEQLIADHTKARIFMEQRKAELEKFERLNDESYRDAAFAFAEDKNIAYLIKSLAELDVEEAKLSVNFAPNHPDRMNIRKLQEQIESVLKEDLQRLNKRVRTEYEVAQKQEKELEALLAKAKQPQPFDGSSGKFIEFGRAKADLETERFVYNQLNTRLRQEMIEMDAPRCPVEIIDPAEPNRRPVSPNLFMNTLISLGLAFVVGLTGGVCLTVGLSKKRA